MLQHGTETNNNTQTTQDEIISMRIEKKHHMTATQDDSKKYQRTFEG